MCPPRARGPFWVPIFDPQMGGSKKRCQNGTLVSGNMDQNLRNPSCLILSHTQMAPDSVLPRNRLRGELVEGDHSKRRSHQSHRQRQQREAPALAAPCKPRLGVWLEIGVPRTGIRMR